MTRLLRLRVPGRGSAVVAALAAAAALAEPALAQVRDSVAVRRDSARAGPALEPITVQAAAPRARALPLATTTLGAADIGMPRAAVGLDEALAAIPGVSAQNRYNFSLDTRIVVRGFGARSAFGVRGVTVLLDGVPQTLPDGQSQLQLVDPAMLNRIDVVRGAAATFYGNGSGGVLVLSSRPLLAARPEARLRVLSGGFGLRQWLAEVRAPIRGGGASLELSRLATNGFRAHNAGDLRQGAAAVELPLSASWRAAARLRVGDLARAENPGALDSAQLRADPAQALARNVAFSAGKTVRQWQGSAEATRATATGSVTLLGYGAHRGLDNPLTTTWVRLRRDGGGGRLIGRWTLGRSELLAGADVQVMRDARTNVDNDSGSAGAALRLDQTETVSAVGARVALRQPLTRRTDAFAGVRLDRIGFSVRDNLTADGDDSGSRTYGALSAAAGLTHQLTPAIRVHVSGGSAFDTPTTTELADPGRGGLNLTLQPQHTLQWEVGLAVVARRVRAALAVYTAAVRDALAPTEVPTAPGRFVYRNAARLAHRGLEAELDAHPWDRVRLVAAGAITRPRFDRFPTDSVPLDGRAVPGVPRATLYLSAIISTPGGATATLELVAQGRTWADDANTAAAAGWQTVNVRAAWPIARGALRMAPFGGVTNLTGERYVGSVNVNGAARRFFEPAPGRAWYVGLDMRWE